MEGVGRWMRQSRTKTGSGSTGDERIERGGAYLIPFTELFTSGASRGGSRHWNAELRSDQLEAPNGAGRGVGLDGVGRAGETGAMRPASPRELAALVDHTLLRPEATAREIEVLCAEAIQAGFAAVCVHGSRVAFARRCLGGSTTRVAAVVGFPLGAVTTRVKCFEAEGALADGAAELDMVLALGQFRDGARDHVRRDIAEVVRVAGGPGTRVKVKVILECGLLTRDEKILACQLAAEAGASMVKTSTGFGVGGATVEDVRLLRANVPVGMGVKAAGGIRDTATALALIEAGATRLGTSRGLELVRGLVSGGTGLDLG